VKFCSSHVGGVFFGKLFVAQNIPADRPLELGAGHRLWTNTLSRPTSCTVLFLRIHARVRISGSTLSTSEVGHHGKGYIAKIQPSGRSSREGDVGSPHHWGCEKIATRISWVHRKKKRGSPQKAPTGVLGPEKHLWTGAGQSGGLDPLGLPNRLTINGGACGERRPPTQRFSEQLQWKPNGSESDAQHQIVRTLNHFPRTDLPATRNLSFLPALSTGGGESYLSAAR